jgi:hypothetical protein
MKDHENTILIPKRLNPLGVSPKSNNDIFIEAQKHEHLLSY